MRKKEKLVMGVGINDSPTPVCKSKKRNGRMEIVWKCPFYTTWVQMLQRAYYEKFKDEHPTYAECSVIEEWLRFSTFKAWMEKQGWKGKYLDKDIIKRGNKVYCPDFCVFVDRKVNNFINTRSACRGRYKIGVFRDMTDKKFVAACSNPITRKREYIGTFTCEDEAHLAWKRRKYELAQELIEQGYVNDPRVAEALLNMYMPESVIE